MNRKNYYKYWLAIFAALLMLCVYPIYMGVKSISIMASNGFVPIEDYPKYIIPYTPIALAVLFGTLLMPLIQRLFKRWDVLPAAVLSSGVFMVSERLMETRILVGTVEMVPLESWQMALCYIPPDQYKTRTWEAVDVLLGGYKPSFKLHFYLISLVLIIAVIGCVYGFGRMVSTGNKSRKKPLVIQSVACIAFLAMCIWACFTAFYRTGEITIPTISALLMAVFFVLLGLVVGAFTGSLTLNRNVWLSVVLPSVLASAATLVMYIGETILLSGNLYRFGTGFLMEPLPAIVLAPIDILIVLAAGGITAGIFTLLNRKSRTLE